MVSKPVGMMDLYLHDINRMWIYVKRYATRISAKGDWSALLCTRVHMYMHLTLLFVTVCVCVCADLRVRACGTWVCVVGGH